MIKGVTLILLIIFGLLEYRFWLGSDSFLEVLKIEKNIKIQHQENTKLRERNNVVLEHIAILKKAPEAIEEQARYELGMIKRGEKFYQIVEPLE